MSFTMKITIFVGFAILVKIVLDSCSQVVRTTVVRIWMWCVAFTMDLVCLMEQFSKVLSSGLSFFNGSFSDRVVVDVAVLRKVTLFRLFNF